VYLDDERLRKSVHLLPFQDSGMQRYFIEVRYGGAGYSGFQVQENAVTVQGELERVLAIYTRKRVPLTGSSRTDGGVHARQNFFHFDWSGALGGDWVYHLNAMLPAGIAVSGIYAMPEGAHCRFDAVGREYVYTIYQRKDPFQAGWGWQYPYPLDAKRLQVAAEMVKGLHNFSAFCKRGVQVKTYQCHIEESVWEMGEESWRYRIRGNRFLRGMVRALVGGMLRVGRGQLGEMEWRRMIEEAVGNGVQWLAPAEGLVLDRVIYPDAWGNWRGE
jgi:tRNA pseudouridine38-40 synthase